MARVKYTAKKAPGSEEARNAAIEKLRNLWRDGFFPEELKLAEVEAAQLGYVWEEDPDIHPRLREAIERDQQRLEAWRVAEQAKEPGIWDDEEDFVYQGKHIPLFVPISLLCCTDTYSSRCINGDIS
jgi:hypothetical protein